jgi:hypothetical protein
MVAARAWNRLRLEATLPNSKTHACWAFALFIAVQVADGILTSIGVSRYGTGVEANPLLVHWMLSYGLWTTLLAAMAVAILGGSLLHLYAYDLVLSGLTAAYVFATVLPWSLLLSPLS